MELENFSLLSDFSFFLFINILLLLLFIYLFIIYFFITEEPSMVKPLGLSMRTQTLGC